VCRHQSSATATGLTADQKTLLRIITGQQQQPHTSRCVLTMLSYQLLGLLYQGGHKPGSGYCPKMKVKEKTKRCNVIDVIFLCSFTHLVTPPKPCSTMKVVTLSSVHPLYRCTSRCVLAMLVFYWGSAWHVATDQENLEYSGISLNMENSGNSVQPEEKIVANKIVLIRHSHSGVKLLLTG